MTIMYNYPRQLPILLIFLTVCRGISSQKQACHFSSSIFSIDLNRAPGSPRSEPVAVARRSPGGRNDIRQLRGQIQVGPRRTPAEPTVLPQGGAPPDGRGQSRGERHRQRRRQRPHLCRRAFHHRISSEYHQIKMKFRTF